MRPVSAACRRGGARRSCGWSDPGQSAAGVLDLLGSQEARLADLAKQSRQAQRYRKLAAELRSTEALLLLARHQAAAAHVEAAVAAVGEAASEQERRLETVSGLRGGRAEAAARLPTLREAASSLQATTAGLRERLASLRATAERETAHLAGLSRQRDEADADLGRAVRAEVDLLAAAGELEDETATTAGGRDRTSQSLAELARTDAAAAESLAAAQAAHHAVLTETAEARAQAATAGEQVAAWRARRDAIGIEVQIGDVSDIMVQAGTLVALARSRPTQPSALAVARDRTAAAAGSLGAELSVVGGGDAELGATNLLAQIDRLTSAVLVITQATAETGLRPQRACRGLTRRRHSCTRLAVALGATLLSTFESVLTARTAAFDRQRTVLVAGTALQGVGVAAMSWAFLAIAYRPRRARTPAQADSISRIPPPATNDQPPGPARTDQPAATKAVKPLSTAGHRRSAGWE